MSMLRFPIAMLAIAAMANASSLQAQETQTKPAPPAKPRVDQPNQTQPPNQTQQLNQTQQPNQAQQPRAQQPNQTLQTQQTPTRQPAGQRPDQLHARGDVHQQAGVSVKQALVKKLQKANQAEIELATMAQKKTQNPELKQLTKMIIEDHKACNEKLQQLSSQPTAGQSQANGNNQVANAAFQPQSAANQAQGVAASGTAASGGMVSQQLCQVMDQATDNALQMTKEMLQKHEAQDFDKAFLRQQCMAHMMMLAELKAIESTGPQELKAFAKETITKVEQHLEKAKQLVKTLDGDSQQKS